MIELSSTAANILLIISWWLLWYAGFTMGRKFWRSEGAKDMLDVIEGLGTIEYVKEEDGKKIAVSVTSEMIRVE